MEKDEAMEFAQLKTFLIDAGLEIPNFKTGLK